VPVTVVDIPDADYILRIVEVEQDIGRSMIKRLNRAVNIAVVLVSPRSEKICWNWGLTTAIVEGIRESAGWRLSGQA
jgi:hypothetical protein